MVAERTKRAIATYGATLCSDGWTDTNSRPLLNVMVTCPAGDVFLGSVDTTGEKKDIAYTTKILEKYIEEVGPQNIVQLCTDNAAVMTGTLKSLNDKYPHMYLQGCAAHVMDLLMEDWGKSYLLKGIVKKCEAIVKFIKRYQYTLAAFRRFSPKKALRMPSKTRFAVNYLVIERLVVCKSALIRLINEPEYMAFENSLFQRKNGPALKL